MPFGRPERADDGVLRRRRRTLNPFLAVLIPWPYARDRLKP
jgi:hypothetical protein